MPRAPASRPRTPSISALDIVNNAYPELKNLPLGATAGLPNLGGAKIELDEADHQGNPQVGQQQTLRLITEDHVAAMLGSYHSSVTLVATAVAERQGIPFVVADSVAANITGRGFKWTFRTTPYRARFRQGLCGISHRPEKIRPQGRQHRGRQRKHRLRLVGFGQRARCRQGRQYHGRGAYRLQRQQLRRLRAGAAAQIGQSGRGDLHQLYGRHHSLFQDHEEPRLPAADHHRRRCRLLRSELHSQCRRSGAGRAQPLAPSISASRAPTATSSTRCSRPNTAAISTTPARAGCKASSCSPTPSTAPARPIRKKSKRR